MKSLLDNLAENHNREDWRQAVNYFHLYKTSRLSKDLLLLHLRNNHSYKPASMWKQLLAWQPTARPLCRIWKPCYTFFRTWAAFKEYGNALGSSLPEQSVRIFVVGLESI